MAQKYQELLLEKISKDELSSIVREALKANFEDVIVEWISNHPNFTHSPWSLASEGICGANTVADIGGPNNIHYVENNGITFDLEEIGRSVGFPKSYVFGPGAASRTIVGKNAELIANCNLENRECESKYSFVDEKGSYVMGDYKSNTIGVLANVVYTEGKRGEVLHIRCRNRIGNLNLVSCIRKALDEKLPDKTLGLAGVFQITSGKIKAHVMPDFTGSDLLCASEVDKWLKFYEMGAPLTCLSVMISNDKNNLELRLEHTHFYSKHGDAGHYHYDVTPSDVEYDGYFIPCDKLVRVAIPNWSNDRKNLFQ